MFPGEGNQLSVFRKYGTEYLCDLDLSLYPFDEEECYMNLKVNSAPKNFLIFDPVLSSVTFSAKTLLVEYEVRVSYRNQS